MRMQPPSSRVTRPSHLFLHPTRRGPSLLSRISAPRNHSVLDSPRTSGAGSGGPPRSVINDHAGIGTCRHRALQRSPRKGNDWDGEHCKERALSIFSPVPPQMTARNTHRGWHAFSADNSRPTLTSRFREDRSSFASRLPTFPSKRWCTCSYNGRARARTFAPAGVTVTSRSRLSSPTTSARARLARAAVGFFQAWYGPSPSDPQVRSTRFCLPLTL